MRLLKKIQFVAWIIAGVVFILFLAGSIPGKAMTITLLAFVCVFGTLQLVQAIKRKEEIPGADLAERAIGRPAAILTAILILLSLALGICLTVYQD